MHRKRFRYQICRWNIFLVCFTRVLCNRWALRMESKQIEQWVIHIYNVKPQIFYMTCWNSARPKYSMNQHDLVTSWLARRYCRGLTSWEWAPAIGTRSRVEYSVQKQIDLWRTAVTCVIPKQFAPESWPPLGSIIWIITYFGINETFR